MPYARRPNTREERTHLVLGDPVPHDEGAVDLAHVLRAPQLHAGLELVAQHLDGARHAQLAADRLHDQKSTSIRPTDDGSNGPLRPLRTEP
jgi:hypothetical protein